MSEKKSPDPALRAFRSLQRISKERGTDMQFLLQRYAAERLLYRIGISKERDRFVLKGAMLFVLWGEEAYRPTRDLDLLGFGPSEPETLAARFREICGILVPEDGIVFLPDAINAKEIREAAEYGGVRVKLVAKLGKTRIDLQVDVGFGDEIFPEPRTESYPTLLDCPIPKIRAYPRETVVAEKLYAAVALGKENSRMKDFYDLFVISRRDAFEGETLARALRATFARRKGGIPRELSVLKGPPPFLADPAKAKMWQSYLRRNRLKGAPEDFRAVGKALASFLSPLLEGAANEGEFRASWASGGPWRRATRP